VERERWNVLVKGAADSDLFLTRFFSLSGTVQKLLFISETRVSGADW